MMLCSAEGCALEQRFLCVRCKHAYYCSEACQRAAWPTHRADCTQRLLARAMDRGIELLHSEWRTHNDAMRAFDRRVHEHAATEATLRVSIGVTLRLMRSESLDDYLRRTLRVVRAETSRKLAQTWAEWLHALCLNAILCSTLAACTRLLSAEHGGRTVQFVALPNHAEHVHHLRGAHGAALTCAFVARLVDDADAAPVSSSDAVAMPRLYAHSVVTGERWSQPVSPDAVDPLPADSLSLLVGVQTHLHDHTLDMDDLDALLTDRYIELEFAHMGLRLRHMRPRDDAERAAIAQAHPHAEYLPATVQQFHTKERASR